MKKIISAILVILITFILQSSVFSRVNIGGIVPNMLIIITACWGFMAGEFYGLLVGFFCGVLMDVFYGSFMGFYAIVYMYLGYFNGKFVNLFMKDDVKMPLALITASDLLYGLTCYIFLFLLRSRFEFTYYLTHIILPEIIMTMIMTLPVYPVMLAVYNKVLVEQR